MVIHGCDCMFSFCVSVWGRHVANVPVPHHGRKPPSDPGADGGECALPAHSSTVCQTAAGGRRCQVMSENCVDIIDQMLQHVAVGAAGCCSTAALNHSWLVTL